MEFEREVELFKRTKLSMDELAGFGINNIEKMDGIFISGFKNNIVDLRNMGFVQISDIMERLLETGDIKDYIYIEFLLKSMENQLYKLLI